MARKQREITDIDLLSAERIKSLRTDSSLTQDDVAKILEITVSTYSRYESGEFSLDTKKIKQLSKYFGVNPVWIIGYDVPKYSVDMKRKHKLLPLVGSIACGLPTTATENIIEYVITEEDDHATFCLRAKGDSMIGARIADGDILFVREQKTVENGEIAAVAIDGQGDSDATVKRFYKYGDTVVLRPENSAYDEMTFKKNEINKLRILGKVISFKSEVK